MGAALGGGVATGEGVAVDCGRDAGSVLITIELAAGSTDRALVGAALGTAALGEVDTGEALGGGVLAASASAARPPLKLGTINRALHSGQMPRLPASSAFTCSLCPLGH
jgi:hypothetical protein